MPDWSQLNKERDVYGELGWVPNFNVKLSKNNDHRHPNFKEFFDKPKEYEKTFTTAFASRPEFYREIAPEDSVA